LLSR
jgi:hypothetical protein